MISSPTGTAASTLFRRRPAVHGGEHEHAMMAWAVLLLAAPLRAEEDVHGAIRLRAYRPPTHDLTAARCRRTRGAATLRARRLGSVVVGAALIVSACASTEHAAARQAQASLLTSAANHFDQAATNGDQAAQRFDRGIRAWLALDGIDLAQLQSYRELEKGVRTAAHVMRNLGATLRSGRTPVTEHQSRKLIEGVTEMRSASSGLLRSLDGIRAGLSEMRTAALELPTEVTAAVEAGVVDFESAIDLLEVMIEHAGAGTDDLERLAEATP